MTKAYRLLEENLRLVDSVIYVLDARAPISCINEEFDKLIKNKPVLYVINKSDLISKFDLTQCLNLFKKLNKTCVSTNSLSQDGAKIVKEALNSLHLNLIEKYTKKDAIRTPRSVVIGVPNCGKSSLINNLIKRKKLETANRPGVTRSIQWIKIDKNIELMDSPGLLFPDFKNQDKAFKLAAIGSIKDERFDFLELAEKLFTKILEIDPNIITSRYADIHKFNSSSTLENIAFSRGLLLSGGKPDIERAAKTFVTDFRKGFLGKVCLDLSLMQEDDVDKGE
jgi:ribosome biogenesis GTPase A